VLWASGFGVGFAPSAPGTWGALVALLFWWWVLADLSVVVQAGICVGFFLLSWWSAQCVCRRFGIDDAPQIVVDEVVGMWLSLLLLEKVWWLALIAFGLFRLLDIVKPGPVGWLDKNVKGGMGVMIDDVLAGIITCGVLYLSVLAFQHLVGSL
jgi:phosphatidylglycerophosphatase A